MPNNATTLGGKFSQAGGVTTGFDYLRVCLSLAILCWHSLGLATGSRALDAQLWSGPFRFVPAAFVPMFFALSGFLVAGSLARNPLHRFLTLRAIRIFPALTVEIVLSAVLIGAMFTTLDPIHYFTSRGFAAYMLNIIGVVHISLPGTFAHNPDTGVMNGQLWTIPFEFECYATLAILSAIGVVAQKRLFLILTVLAVLAFTVGAAILAPVSAQTHLPGRALVFAFLFGVLIYTYRDSIPYSNILGFVAIAASILCLNVPALAFIAAAPIAYVTVWAGVKQPPAIKFGDLSYGIFLFHFPILQVIIALTGNVLPWWALALVATPVVGLVAFGSWTLIEQPILRRKKVFLGYADRAVDAVRAKLSPPKPMLEAAAEELP